MAAEVRAAGHFDKVIMSIDQVIHLLHKEEAAGVEHRDRGQNREKKSNDLEDLGHSINKSGKATTRLGKEQSQLQDEILVRAFTPACDHDQFPLHMHVTMLQSDNSKHSQKQRR